MSKVMNKRNEVNILKDVIRNPYAWPGGYERAIVTTDGGLVCHKCAKEEYYTMLHSTRGEYNDGWDVAGSVLVEELTDSPSCDHCGEALGQ